GFADGNGENLARTLDFVAFADLGIVAHDDGADVVLFERQGEPGDAMGEAEQLAGHHLVEAVESGDPVAERGDGADFVDLHLGIVIRDLLAKNLSNLVCLDLSHLQSLQFSVFGCQFSVALDQNDGEIRLLLTSKNQLPISVSSSMTDN